MVGPPEAVVREVLRRWGDGRAPEVLGAGMEGVVHALDDDRVAKIWNAGAPERLRTVQSFHAALAARGAGLATPRLDEVAVVDGWTVTVERRLPGRELASELTAGTLDTVAARAACVEALTQLAGVGPLPEARELAVLDEPHPLYAEAPDFPAALAALTRRRVQRFGDVLTAAVPGLDRLVAALPSRLREVDSGRRSVVHGDLFPGNVLVDHRGRPSALLDWGFLTTEGDPAFDAAVAAALFDMYGEHALANEHAMTELVHDALGCGRTALLVYRATYSVVTANAYSADGSDGHFAWCAAALRRPDVVAAVLG